MLKTITGVRSLIKMSAVVRHQLIQLASKQGAAEMSRKASSCTLSLGICARPSVLVSTVKTSDWMNKPSNIISADAPSLTEILRLAIPVTDLPNDPRYSSIIIPETIGDEVLDGKIIGYNPSKPHSSTVSCSSILKKRKQKMNKHKYKKRRKRDKFKRRNLENIKERKQKVRDKADERAKQVVG